MRQKSFSGLLFGYERAFNHLSLKLIIFYRHTVSFKSSKFRFLVILNFI